MSYSSEFIPAQSVPTHKRVIGWLRAALGGVFGDRWRLGWSGVGLLDSAHESVADEQVIDQLVAAAEAATEASLLGDQRSDVPQPPRVTAVGTIEADRRDRARHRRRPCRAPERRWPADRLDCDRQRARRSVVGDAPPAAPVGGYVSAACLMPIGLVLVGVPDTLAALALLALLFGMPFAPFSVAGGELMHRLAPPGMSTESFTWVTTALIAGAASGQAMTGALIDHAGWRAAAVACATVGTAGAALLLTRHSSLTTTPAEDAVHR